MVLLPAASKMRLWPVWSKLLQIAVKFAVIAKQRKQLKVGR
jgi:hypothetical protein